MGRRRASNLSLPPRMHKKGETYYHVSSSLPRKWTSLGKDLARARTKWVHIENAGMTDKVSDCIDQWMESKSFQDLSQGTKVTYGSVIKQLKEFFSGAHIAEIEPFHIAQWIDNHRSKIQANTGKAIMSKVFKWAIRNGLVKVNPCSDIDSNAIKGRDFYLEHEQFLAIRENAAPFMQIAMDIGYLTSARPSDILKAKWSDVREEGFYITAKKNKSKQLFVWSQDLRDTIEAAKGLGKNVKGMTIICNENGKPYTYSTFNEYWTKARAAAGLPEAQFRDIRSKAATDASEMDRDHQQLLGDRSKKVADGYIKKVRRPTRVEPMKKVSK